MKKPSRILLGPRGLPAVQQVSTFAARNRPGVPVDFHYRFPQGVSHTTRWEVSLVVESETETVSLTTELRHSLLRAGEKVVWTLKELRRQGPPVPLPPYLQSGQHQIPLSTRGVPAPGYAVPCFLLPAFPDQIIEKDSEWTVEDKSSGVCVVHIFTVLEERPGHLRLVGDAHFESDDLEIELGGDYTFDTRQGLLTKAKIAIDSFREGLARNLAIQIKSE